jgi:hypothetical protein
VFGNPSSDDRVWLFASGSDNKVNYNVKNWRGDWTGWAEYPGGGRTIDSPTVMGDRTGPNKVIVRWDNSYVYESTVWHAPDLGQCAPGPADRRSTQRSAHGIRGLRGHSRGRQR